MTALTFDDLIQQLGDDAYFLQTAKTELVRLMATGQVDATGLARREMAQRGLNENGAWIGFAAAAKLWEEPTPARKGKGKKDKVDKATLDAGLEALAQVHLGIGTLTERRMDALDFHEVGVWQVKDALRAAFMLGRASK